MSTIQAARSSLLKQLEPLAIEHAEAKERLDAIEQTKTMLEAALKALEEPRKAKSKATRKASKPYARKDDVMAVCVALVQANQPIAKSDLKSLAKHKLSEDQGFNLSGVSLRLSECLASETFQVDADGMVTVQMRRTDTASKMESTSI